jgi:hypothetical protein
MEITIEYQPILEAPAALERDQAPTASGVKSIKNNRLCKTKPILPNAQNERNYCPHKGL